MATTLRMGSLAIAVLAMYSSEGAGMKVCQHDQNTAVCNLQGPTQKVPG